MGKFKAVGLLAVIVAACPALAVAQNAGEAERAESRLREAGRLEQQGMGAVAVGNHASAVIPLEATLMIREKAQGPDHPDTLRVLNNLGLVFLTLGQTKEAEALLGRALASMERTLGPDHPAVADALHNLAAASTDSDDTRRIEAALPLLERAAAIRTQALGPENPRTAESLQAIARVDLSLAHRAGARRMSDLLGGARPKLAREAYLDRAGAGFSRALAIREKALGPDHRDVAASLRGLASVCVERGDYARAEPLMKRALAIAEKAMGPDNPALAAALDDYATILGNARKGAADAEVKALKVRAAPSATPRSAAPRPTPPLDRARPLRPARGHLRPRRVRMADPTGPRRAPAPNKSGLGAGFPESRGRSGEQPGDYLLASAGAADSLGGRRSGGGPTAARRRVGSPAHDPRERPARRLRQRLRRAATSRWRSGRGRSAG